MFLNKPIIKKIEYKKNEKKNFEYKLGHFSKYSKYQIPFVKCEEEKNFTKQFQKRLKNKNSEIYENNVENSNDFHGMFQIFYDGVWHNFLPKIINPLIYKSICKKFNYKYGYSSNSEFDEKYGLNLLPQFFLNCSKYSTDINSCKFYKNHESIVIKKMIYFEIFIFIKSSISLIGYLFKRNF